jgi:hypothetical protein
VTGLCPAARAGNAAPTTANSTHDTTITLAANRMITCLE